MRRTQMERADFDESAFLLIKENENLAAKASGYNCTILLKIFM